MSSTQQKHTGRRRSITTLATLGACVALLLGSAQAAQAAGWDSYHWDEEDNGDVGSHSVGVGMISDDDVDDAYEVLFHSKGEWLSVMDGTPDKKQAKAYLKVEGSGTATFTNHYQEKYDLSFAEGKDVRVRVCIEGTSTCSEWSSVGTT